MFGKFQRNTASDERRYQSGWKKLRAALAPFVILATVSSLVLPAITMSLEKETDCTIAEHQHTEVCYTSTEEKTLSCSYGSLGVHEHEKDCYDDQKNLICQIPDFLVHTHEDLCYQGDALVCKLPELKEHQHTPECYGPAPVDPGHTHTDACYTWTDKVCPLEETPGHSHGESCYAVGGELLCKLQETVGHSHDHTCYAVGGEMVCTLEASADHSHEGSCYAVAGTQLCPQAESLGHSHEAECYAVGGELFCGQEECPPHTHDDSCSGKVRGELICGEQEREPGQIIGEPVLTCEDPEITLHTHEEDCYIFESELNETTETWILDLVRQQQEAEALEAMAITAEEQEDKQYLICTQVEIFEHIHGEGCFQTKAGEPKLTCETPEHTHSDSCGEGQLVAPEEELRSEIMDVITLIDALPEAAEAQAELDAFASEEEKLAAEAELISQIQAARAGYDALTQEQKPLVFNYEKLTQLEAHFAITVPTLPGETSSASESTLEFVAEEFTTTVIASGDANLPADTVVTAKPLFDSNEPAVAAFSLFSDSEETTDEPAQEDGSVYAQQIMDAITWGEVTRIKLFDISLTSANGEVQPSASVQVRTEFAEPMAVSGDEFIYGVHIGDNGQVDILPATTERDADGNITAITHTQSSFSPTGYVYVLEHEYNGTHITDQVLPVHYCIWVNDQWIVAGSTRYGWYGNYTNASDWATDKRDYITVEKMYSVLKDYGFMQGALVDSNGMLDYSQMSKGQIETYTQELKETVWYQRAEKDGMTIRHDTTPVYQEVTLKDNQKTNAWVFPLSGNLVKDEGYHIYYVPKGTESGKEAQDGSTYASNADLAADLRQESKFFTMTVRDRIGVVYDGTPGKEQDKIPEVKVYRYGSYIEVTVLKNLSEDGKTNLGWQWVNDKGAVVNGQNPVLNGAQDDRFGYKDNGDGTETYTFDGILGRTTLIPFSNAVDGAEIGNKQVDIAVHLDGKWQKVGQIDLMYKHDGVCVNTTDNKPMWFVTSGQVYAVLKDFGFDPDYHPDDSTNKGHVFAHAIGAFSENMVMHADGVNEDINGLAAIGFGHDVEGNNNFTLFYLPGSGEGNEDYTDVHNVKANDYADPKNINTQTGLPFIAGDRFYSVTVKDEYQLIYYGYEVDNFKVYVPEGEPVEIKLENNQSVLWSVREPWKTDPERMDDWQHSTFTVSSDGNYSHYTFAAVNTPVSIEASSMNPNFTVQYYTDLERYKLYDTPNPVDEGVNIQTVSLIDTSGGKLPTNNFIQSRPSTDAEWKYPDGLLYLGLTNSGENETQNAGDDSIRYNVKTYTDRTAIYAPGSFDYEKHHTWESIDKLYKVDDYQISSISILKDGHDPTSIKEDDFWIYEAVDNGANISFTNMASEEYAPRVENDKGETEKQPAKDAGGNTIYYRILVTEGMILRLHYTRENKTTPIDATFYDYDISEGEDTNNVYDTGLLGINSNHNYSTVGTDVLTTNRYAFGNVNCLTGTGNAKWNGQYLNKYNWITTNLKAVYQGCTFGLVDGIDANGNVDWSTGVEGLDIFGTKTAKGKYNYSGTLTFKHEGDVHTLTSATVANSHTLSNLDHFFHPSPYAGKTYTHIFTNNFWALDGKTNEDGHWGKVERAKNTSGTWYTKGDPLGRVEGYVESEDNKRGDAYSWSRTNAKYFPESDDGNAHNWFFGMSFGVGFTLSEDYVGPMEYIFFGDDDMWVFLETLDANNQVTNTQLICDIGGVHSSVGEYVNLRDYLPNGSSGNYNLKFYYTERGASGSTCWMSFTLPNSTSTHEEDGTSTITLEKELQNLAGETINGKESYQFRLTFYEDQTKQTIVPAGLSIEIKRANGQTDHFSTNSGRLFNVNAGDKYTISGAPVGSWYVLEETSDDRFDVFVNGQKGSNYVQGRVLEGVVEEQNFASFRNVYKGYTLPNTGGPGIFLYIFSGIALMGAVLLIYEHQRKPIGKGGK